MGVRGERDKVSGNGLCTHKTNHRNTYTKSLVDGDCPWLGPLDLLRLSWARLSAAKKKKLRINHGTKVK